MKVFVGALVLVSSIALIDGGALFSIKLLEFSNWDKKTASGHCCESFSTGVCAWFEGGCDHEFTLCLDSVHSPNPATDMDSCRYGKFTSGKITNNHITFTDDINGMKNPTKIMFRFAWPGAIRVKIQVSDQDDYTRADVVDTYVTDHRVLQPRGEVEQEEVKGKGKIRTSIKYELSVECNLYAFGPNCSDICVPLNDKYGHYDCEPLTGKKVCLTGYTDPGTDCMTPTPCLGVDCQNGGTCSVVDQSYKCACSTGFAGKHCENYVGVNANTTTPAI